MYIALRSSRGPGVGAAVLLVVVTIGSACSSGGGGRQFPDTGSVRLDRGQPIFVYDIGVRDRGLPSGLCPNIGFGGGGDAGVGSLVDPAPEVTAKGLYALGDGGVACQDCPGPPLAGGDDAGAPPAPVTDLKLLRGVTKATIAGGVARAPCPGVYFVRGAGGLKSAGIVPTNPQTGAFGLEVPLFCGQQLIKLVWRNAFGRYVQAVAVNVTDCVGVDMLLTLTWDAIGRDWDLHLIKPGGKINDTIGLTDCTSSTCVTSSPDWGVRGDPTDNPHKDVDDTGGEGPENIFLTGAEAGTYTVLVEHAGLDGSKLSTGTLELRVEGQDRVAIIHDNLPPQHVWKAATITWPSGTVTPSHEVIDCTANWNEGCRLSIP